MADSDYSINLSGGVHGIDGGCKKARRMDIHHEGSSEDLGEKDREVGG